ncbi:MAG TPA: glycosyltransferase family 2 protein [Phycisphaerae bacterium]|nr:glycosyltransferase family 2 protein [Phycisphaerae bacterium]HPP29231.1 glycosyltransferase family 2 protein [Phycisphaerae bacterium]
MAASVEPIRAAPASVRQDDAVTPLVSIIIPAYNEAAGIGSVLDELCDEPALAEAQIVVVDDGSSDETASIVRRFPRVQLVQNRVNRGYGAAIRTGTRAARGQYVVWFDADAQHRVEDLLRVVEQLTQQDLDYCIGVRDAGSHVDVRRWVGKWILKQVVRFAAGQPVRDFNSGLRGFRREVLERYLHLLPKGFGASTTTTLLMLERGYVGSEVFIRVRERKGKSSVRQFRDGFRTLLLILRIFVLFKPLHFFGSIAAVSILSGSIYGIREALRYSLGFPTLASVVILFGVQMLVLGLLCDQISAMRRERFE